MVLCVFPKLQKQTKIDERGEKEETVKLLGINKTCISKTISQNVLM